MNASPRYAPDSHHLSALGPRLWAFVMAAVAAGSAVFWMLQWPTAVAHLPASISPTSRSGLVPDSQAVATLLGSGVASQATQVLGSQTTHAANLLAARMALVGVVGTTRQTGMALIAIDGKPARTFTVGSPVEGNLVLQSVSKTQALLANHLDSQSVVVLELPKRK